MKSDSTFIGKNVSLGSSVCIGDNVKILGDVNIGSNVAIGDNVIIGYPSKKQLEKLRSEQILGATTRILDIESSISGKTKIGDGCIIYPNTIICAGAKLGENSETYVGTFIGEESKIGVNASIRYGAQIYRYVRIGDNTTISGFCCNRSVLGDDVSMFGILVHKYRRPRKGQIEVSPVIKDEVVIGWNAIIIGGVTVGEGAYVGAGSVVTTDIEPYQVIVGVPAKRVLCERS